MIGRWNQGSCGQYYIGWDADVGSISSGWVGARNWPWTVQRGVWFHWAMTYDGNFPKCYINGQLVLTFDISTGASCAVNFLIGARHAYDSPTELWSGAGLLDEIRVWNVERTQSELAFGMDKILTGVGPSLLGYWRFESPDNLGLDVSMYNLSTTLPFTSQPVSPDSPALTVASLTVGDPIVIGFGGQRFEFIGEEDAAYSWFSTPELQVNVLLRRPTPGSGLFVGAVVVLFDKRGKLLLQAFPESHVQLTPKEKSPFFPHATVFNAGHCGRLFYSPKKAVLRYMNYEVVLHIRRHVKHGQVRFPYINIAVNVHPLSNSNSNSNNSKIAMSEPLLAAAAGVLGQTLQSGNSISHNSSLSLKPSDFVLPSMSEAPKSHPNVLFRGVSGAMGDTECASLLQSPL